MLDVSGEASLGTFLLVSFWPPEMASTALLIEVAAGSKCKGSVLRSAEFLDKSTLSKLSGFRVPSGVMVDLNSVPRPLYLNFEPKFRVRNFLVLGERPRRPLVAVEAAEAAGVACGACSRKNE